jgi:hypothetical protein
MLQRLPAGAFILSDDLNKRLRVRAAIHRNVFRIIGVPTTYLVCLTK